MAEEVKWQLSFGKKKRDSNTRPESHDDLKCSFCGKSQAEVAKLIANPSERGSRAYICNECIEVRNLIIEEDPK